MYEVIRKFRNMRTTDEAARRVVEGLGPILKQSPGFRAYYVFEDSQGGGGSVSLFESRKAAEAANEKAIAWIRENLTEFFDGRPPEVTMGEVRGSVTSDPAHQLSEQGHQAGRDDLLRRSVDEIVPEPERIGEGDHPMREQVRRQATSSQSSS